MSKAQCLAEGCSHDVSLTLLIGRVTGQDCDAYTMNVGFEKWGFSCREHEGEAVDRLATMMRERAENEPLEYIRLVLPLYARLPYPDWERERQAALGIAQRSRTDTALPAA